MPCDIFTRAGNETRKLKAYKYGQVGRREIESSPSLVGAFFVIMSFKSSRRFVSSSDVDVSVYRVLLTAVLLVTASKRLPEFAGFRGRRYPGTCPPRRKQAEPWRPRVAHVAQAAPV